MGENDDIFVYDIEEPKVVKKRDVARGMTLAFRNLDTYLKSIYLVESPKY